jgi:3-deoxy-D-manno-octulosonic-acid transferase
MVEAGALVQLPAVITTEEITNVFSNLLASPGDRDALGRRAKQLVTDNQGATDKTIKLILFTANAHTS